MVLSWILVLKLVPGDPGLSAGSNSKEGSERWEQGMGSVLGRLWLDLRLVGPGELERGSSWTVVGRSCVR